MRPPPATSTAQTPMDAPPPGTYVPAFDAIRGIGMVMVLIYHFAIATPAASRLGQLTHRVIEPFWLGVDLFFVLSGFLITGILLQARESPHYFRNFYVRRVLRIFPLYYVALSLVFLILPHFLPTSDPGVQRILRDQGWLWLYGSNLAAPLAGELYFHAGWLNLNHFWSLAVEEHFYFLWPTLVYFLPRKRLAHACLGLVAVACLLRLSLVLGGASWMWSYMFTPARMDELALGALLAVLARDGHWAILRRVAPHTLRLSVALLLGLAVWRGGLLMWDNAVIVLGYPLLALFSASILVLTATPRPGTLAWRFAHQPLLLWVGRHSYGMYVFHMIMRPALEHYMAPARLAALLGSPRLGDIAYVVLASLLSALVALLSWNLMEKPLVKLKKYFEYAPPRAPKAASPSAA